MLQLLYVQGRTAAFTVYGELYYLKTGPDLPQLYDSNLKKMIIGNMDHWFQAQTHQRYSYSGMKDMMDAYAAGLSRSYTSNDIPALVEKIYAVTRDVMLKTEFVRDYATAYWVELLDPKKLARLTSEITESFDELRGKWGEERLYSYLCRLRSYCSIHVPGEVPVYDRMLGRLGRGVGEPQYPQHKFELEAVKQIANRVVDHRMALYKDIPDEIVSTVRQLHVSK